MPSPSLQPHEGPACDWLAFWVVPALLPDVADDVALFDWLTLPSEPGLSTRTGDAVFDGSIWVAPDAASEPCSVPACWFASWMASAPQPQPPAWDWDAPWVVPARLPAVADDDASFDCDTEPPSPGLRTRIETFEFDGSTCFAADSAAAV